MKYKGLPENRRSYHSWYLTRWRQIHQWWLTCKRRENHYITTPSNLPQTRIDLLTWDISRPCITAYLRLVLRLGATCVRALRKARAERCSSFSWILLLEPSVISSSLISWIWRSCGTRISDPASTFSFRNLYTNKPVIFQLKVHQHTGWEIHPKGRLLQNNTGVSLGRITSLSCPQMLPYPAHWVKPS